MRVLGLIGGTGWVSTAEYYKRLNEEANKRAGGHMFPELLLYSVNYGELLRFAKENRTEQVEEILVSAAVRVENAGAQGLILCANTLHRYAGEVSRYVNIPVIHIGDAVGRAILKREHSKVGLLGTRQTMEMEFYRKRLAEMYITTLIPPEKDRFYIEDIIEKELIKNYFGEETRERFVEIIEGLASKGAESVILGCTEISLLIKQEHTEVSLIDSLHAHVATAVDFIFS